MCATGKSSPFAASTRNVDNRSRKLLRSYLEVVNYMLKKFATDKAIAEFDAAILRYIQQANMTPEQHANHLVAISGRVAHIRDILIESVDPSICSSLKHHCAQNAQTDITDIVFQAVSLLFIPKGANATATNNQNTCNQGKTHSRKPWSNRSSANFVSSNTTTTSTSSSRQGSTSPPAPHVHKPDRPTAVTGSAPSSSSLLSLFQFFFQRIVL